MWLLDFVRELLALIASLLAVGGFVIAFRRQFPIVWERIWARIWAKPRGKLVTTALTYYDVQLGMSVLVNEVRRFQPDVLIGINRGGAIVGGILGKHLEKLVFVLEVTNRDPIDDGPAMVARIKHKRVLLVDDRFGSGRHMNKASKFLRQHTTDLRTAVFALVQTERKGQGPDFYAYRVNSEDVTLPWEPGYSAQWGKERSDNTFTEA